MSAIYHVDRRFEPFATTTAWREKFMDRPLHLTWVDTLLTRQRCAHNDYGIRAPGLEITRPLPWVLGDADFEEGAGREHIDALLGRDKWTDFNLRYVKTPGLEAIRGQSTQPMVMTGDTSAAAWDLPDI